MKRLVALSLTLVAGPAMAVGMSPLSKSGITDSEGKAFYLTIINPYPSAELFEATPLLTASEEPAFKAAIFPARMIIGAGGRRKVLVVIHGLEPGETYDLRVCAQRPVREQEIVHVRVCSKLSAHRLPVRRPDLDAGRPGDRPGRVSAAGA